MLQISKKCIRSATEKNQIVNLNDILSKNDNVFSLIIIYSNYFRSLSKKYEFDQNYVENNQYVIAFNFSTKFQYVIARSANNKTFLKIIFPRNNPSCIIYRAAQFFILSFCDDPQASYAIYTPYPRNRTSQMREKQRSDEILKLMLTFSLRISAETILAELYTLDYCFFLGLADSLDAFLFNFDLIEGSSLLILPVSSCKS